MISYAPRCGRRRAGGGLGIAWRLEDRFDLELDQLAVVAAAAFSAAGLVSDVVLTISIDFWK